MVFVDVSEKLKEYLSQGQRDLLEQGIFLIEDVESHGRYDFADYSFLVFPFAKAYEGFLKQLFLDVGFITKGDYVSNHFRLGKVLSPNLQKRLAGRSVYKRVCDAAGCDLGERIWKTWKLGRNEVFHYFPHNLKSLSLAEAKGTAGHIVEMMEQAFVELLPHKKPS